MFLKKLEYSFLLLVTIATLLLSYNFYKSYTFKHNPIPKSYFDRITKKENNVLYRMQKYYGFKEKFPIIITDKIPGKLYGLTTYKNGKITILLNKKVMQESMDYIVSDVIPHEYAHALLFYLGKDTSANGGHTKEWKLTCQKLGGSDCHRFVNQHEVVMDKLGF